MTRQKYEELTSKVTLAAVKALLRGDVNIATPGQYALACEIADLLFMRRRKAGSLEMQIKASTLMTRTRIRSLTTYKANLRALRKAGIFTVTSTPRSSIFAFTEQFLDRARLWAAVAKAKAKKQKQEGSDDPFGPEAQDALTQAILLELMERDKPKSTGQKLTPRKKGGSK